MDGGLATCRAKDAFATILKITSVGVDTYSAYRMSGAIEIALKI